MKIFDNREDDDFGGEQQATSITRIRGSSSRSRLIDEVGHIFDEMQDMYARVAHTLAADLDRMEFMRAQECALRESVRKHKESFERSRTLALTNLLAMNISTIPTSNSHSSKQSQSQRRKQEPRHQADMTLIVGQSWSYELLDQFEELAWNLCILGKHIEQETQMLARVRFNIRAQYVYICKHFDAVDEVRRDMDNLADRIERLQCDLVSIERNMD